MSTRNLLSPLAGLYEAGVALRLALYRRGLFHVTRAGRPVVSVGNLAAGGTGKTPFVRWLAGELLERGHRPAILTRGYGRATGGPVLVSDGAGHVASVAEAGDEATLLARALPGVPILADGRRLRAAAAIEARFPDVSIHLLDDGFSHVALEREADIVLLDATAPDAGGALLPAGRLREPLASLARADLVVITKTDQADPARAAALAQAHAPGVPVYSARTDVLGIFNARDELVSARDLPGGTLVGVAGIARPDSFRVTLDACGIEPVAFLPFPDHTPYGPAAIERILRIARRTGATAAITTEKDAVKLQDRLPMPVFRVAIEMRATEPGFASDLLALLGRRPS